MKNKIVLILLAAVLVLSLSIVGCTTPPAEEEEEEEEPEVIELIFSDHAPLDHPIHRAVVAYANYIAEHSDGRAEIERIGYGGEILSDLEAFEGVQNGTADCAHYVPDIGDGLEYFQVMQMPFMGWGTAQKAVSIFWQLADDYPEILGQFPSTLTLDTLYMMPAYHLHYYAEDFVADAPDDIAGLEIICLADDNLVSILNMLGATGMRLSFDDVLDQVPKGMGDGFAIHSEFTYGLALLPYFHSHTLFLGGIMMMPIGMLWNTESYNAVVEAVGEEVMNAARAIYCETFDLWITVHTKGALEWWVTHGDTVTSLNSTQTEVWAAAVADYVEDWESVCDDPAKAKAIYDAAKAYIAAL
jgi:TRAP-type C4-dicarboxylate transport system substrate-binding protein